MKEFKEKVLQVFADWDGSEEDFKKRKRKLQKEFHPDNEGDEIFSKMANELSIEDVDIFEYDGNDRTRISGLKHSITLECFKIPEGVEVICDESFWHKEAWHSKETPKFNVKTLIFPKSLKIIGVNAFRNVHCLNTVIFEHEENQDVTIYHGAFSNTMIGVFDFKCKMSMEMISANTKNKYTIFHNCIFLPLGHLPFDISKVKLFGVINSQKIDGIWNGRKVTEQLQERIE